MRYRREPIDRHCPVVVEERITPTFGV